MNNTDLLREAAILTQVNKFVGVAIALIGAFIVAPDGASRILQISGTRIRSRVNRFRRSTQKITLQGLSEEGRASDAMSVQKNNYPWMSDAPIDERIETLHRYIIDLEKRLNDTMSAVSQERGAREEALTELNRTFTARLDELHRLLQEKERQTATIDARGLPVIGFGVVLSGIPEALAEIPLHVGWALPFAGFAWMVVAARDGIRDRRATSAS
ncbi:hypothetical protein DQ384_38145 [Sphaerisporangium album]|uniref:Uncharacterized protein n=1 Tax=Sphaerisporangium album TaxID=509200 RepID=A0A367EM12_9ACTN|nr:hypothetical protein [Sphaerisporangium album]RCG19104.1 hypothetical protein DQ384_38145 [Sphaerisporangium album]